MDARKLGSVFLCLLAPHALAVAATTLIAGSSEGPYRSTDGGATWKQIWVSSDDPAVQRLGLPALTCLTIDPQNPVRIDVVFSVQTDLPVKTDSHVKIMSMSPLGDNHLEILPGGAQTALAPPGSLLPSDTYVDFNTLTAQINDLTPQAQQLIQSLNDRATQLKVTVDRVNDLLSAENRANLSATLADARGMIEENRPQIKSTIQHLDTVTQKLEPLLQDLHKATDEANQALTHVDAVVRENRADVRQSVNELRKSLTTLTDITGRLDQTLQVNSENIDELLDNFRHVSQNLKAFTDTIKKRPYTLIRATNSSDHNPGEQQ